MKNFILVFALLFVVPVAEAQYTGHAAYAARSPRFPCDAYLNLVGQARYPAMSVLWEGFGDDDTCVVRFLDANRDRPHLLQIHPFDLAAVNARTTEPGMAFYGLSKSKLNRLIEARDPGIMAAIDWRFTEIANFFWAHGNANTQALVSTGLEDQYSAKAFAVVVERARLFCPWLINRSGSATNGLVFFLEKHGRSAKADVVDEDGSVDSLKQSKAFLDRNVGALAKFTWRAENQGRTVNNRPVYPRTARDFEISQMDVEQLGELLSHY